MSKIYSSKLARRGLRRRGWRAWTPLRFVLIIGLGGLLVLIAGVASAAILLRGRGTLVAPAVQQQNLQVGNLRLSRPLTPGATADLLFSVRNPNAFGARVDQVTLVGGLRKAKPTGCTAKVSGPVTKPAGYRLPRADQVLVGAGAQRNVIVRGAFALAASAKSGCGFTVEVDVSATQLPPAASPTTVTPTTAPTSTPTAPSPPHSLPTTTAPTTTAAAIETPPGTGPIDSCDMLDPVCALTTSNTS